MNNEHPPRDCNLIEFMQRKTSTAPVVVMTGDASAYQAAMAEVNYSMARLRSQLPPMPEPDRGKR